MGMSENVSFGELLCGKSRDAEDFIQFLSFCSDLLLFPSKLLLHRLLFSDIPSFSDFFPCHTVFCHLSFVYLSHPFTKSR